MKLSLSLLLAFVVIGFWACGADPEPAAPTPPTPALAPNVQAAPQPGTTTVALNPAHGQPGHRCDIAVGAPLDGSAAPQSPPQIDMSKMSPGAAPATATPVPAGNGAAPTVNPPHGQPGHRCDIAVGAPLN
jgi:hypothetical protein